MERSRRFVFQFEIETQNVNAINPYTKMNMATIDGESSAGESHRSPKPRRRRTPTSARSAVAAVVSVAMIRYPLHPNVMQSGRQFVRPDRLSQIPAKAGLVAKPCAALPTRWSLANEAIDHLWYSEKPSVGTSVRAGIEPLSGLNA